MIPLSAHYGEQLFSGLYGGRNVTTISHNTPGEALFEKSEKFCEL
jgi:hypothetical protein